MHIAAPTLSVARSALGCTCARAIPALLCLVLIVGTTSIVQAKSAALIVGISQYQNDMTERNDKNRSARSVSSLNSLSYASNDAQRVHDMLTSSPDFAGATVVFLKDQEATKNAIEQGLRRIVRESEREPFDKFFFFFSGHGLPQNYIPDRRNTAFLAPTDASLAASDWNFSGDLVFNSTMISRLDLASQLASVRASVVVVVLDSCYSGARDFGELVRENIRGHAELDSATHSVGSGGADGPKGLERPNFVPMESEGGSSVSDYRGHRLVLFASSGDDQESREYSTLKSGALTYAFLESVQRIRAERFVSDQVNAKVGQVHEGIQAVFTSQVVDGHRLSERHQPHTMPLPNSEMVSSETVVTLPGLKPVLPATGTLNLNLQGGRAYVSVDGKSLGERGSLSLDLTEGQHFIDVELPQLSFRQTLTVYVQRGVDTNRTVNLTGNLRVLTQWDGASRPEGAALRPVMNMYLDGEPVGSGDNLTVTPFVGTHRLRVIGADGTPHERYVEIRADSPLEIHYFVKYVAPAPPPPKPHPIIM